MYSPAHSASVCRDEGGSKWGGNNSRMLRLHYAVTQAAELHTGPM
jgi:hypothetical protein